MVAKASFRRDAARCASLFFVLTAAGCDPGGTAAADAPADLLRERFPALARTVLEARGTFVPTADGFLAEEASAGGASRHAEIEMPRDAAGPIRFRSAGGSVIEVRETGARGHAALAGHALVYPSAGGASFWAAVPGGVEEWLHLEAGVARDEEHAVATWEITGGTARQRGDAVLVVDAGGFVRVRVTAPSASTVLGRALTPRLRARGTRIELLVDADGEEVLVDPLWIPTGSLALARYSHTATRLPDGRVLVAGGWGTFGSTATAELYDPATGMWSAAASMVDARNEHTATLLPNGKVLVAGGTKGGIEDPKGAEPYDPATDTWSPAGSLSVARYEHTATLLPDGKVLLAAGTNHSVFEVASAELYDPATNTWSAAAPLSQIRRLHTATLLPDGRVLVVGGTQQKVFPYDLPSVEIYDPAANTWSVSAPLSQPRKQHTATLLSTGEVLVAGGYAGGISVKTALLYDPATSTWSPAADMGQTRYAHEATVLATGQVLLSGNPVLSGAVELYDPLADAWSPAGSMSIPRWNLTASLLENGDVLVAGGQDGNLGATALAELYVGPSPNGGPCADAADCETGFCADGVCCDTACDAGPCDACSAALGASADGTCTPLSGTACDDGDACTRTDACQVGVCTGSDPVVCPALDECQTGTCDPRSGACSTAEEPDGTPCEGGTCEAGTCVPSSSSTGSGSGGGAGSGGSGGGATGGGGAGGGGIAGNGGDAGSGGGAGDGPSGGCGCHVQGSTPAAGTFWIGLGMLLALRRRRARSSRTG